MPVTREEALQAFDVFSEVLHARKDDVADAMAKHGRFSFERLDGATSRRKMAIGNRIVSKYRRDTGRTGAIDWNKFKDWCNTHWKAILAIKAILTVLMMFCL